MDAERSQPREKRANGSGAGSLGSWKEIAAYLKRDERTVRRWEKEGLPVYRHMHKKRASIYAFTSEIDDWWSRDRTRLQAEEPGSAPQSRRFVVWIVAAVLALPLAVLAMTLGGMQDRLFKQRRDDGPAGIRLAVLPLKNLLGDAAQDHYADGLTEALITELGKIARFDVVSFQSSSRYRQTAKPLPEIARELQVDVVLEGSVMRSQGRVLVTTKLFQAMPERQLLSGSYEFEPQDIVAVQAKLARDVAGRALVKLTPQVYWEALNTQGALETGR